MGQFLGALVLTIFVVCSFFFAVRYSVVHKYDVEATINFDPEKLSATFSQDPDKENKKLPFIISAKVQESSNDMLVLDVVTYAPDDGTVYVLSVLPERSDFAVNEQVLKPGANVERISVFFDPNNSFKRSVDTEFLNFYIHANGGEREFDKTYVRKANFVKSWRKIRQHNIWIRRTEFYTK